MLVKVQLETIKEESQAFKLCSQTHPATYIRDGMQRKCRSDFIAL